MADPRRISFIIVPHGELRTRTYEVSYRVLTALLGVGFLLLAVFVVMMASWWFVATQAARVPGLEEEVARLEGERAKVAALARDLEEAERQYARVRRLLGVAGGGGTPEVALPPLRGEVATGQPEELSAVRPTSWPLTQPGLITQMREVTEDASHPGLDIAVPADSYIRATAPGRVVDAGVDEVYGRYILLDHGDGLESMYGHASRLFVQPGEQVEQDEVIALSGSTGRSTAPHLHFEIRKDGQAVDPLTYVRQPT